MQIREQNRYHQFKNRIFNDYFLNKFRFPTRNIMLRELIDRFKVSKPFDQFLSDLFPTSKPGGDPQSNVVWSSVNST